MKPFPRFRPVVLMITGCQIQLAHILAQQRKQGHDHCRTASQSLGSDAANLDADFWGVLAEIVLMDALERAGYKPYYTLLRSRPPFGLDLRMDDKTFDVKASPPDKPYLYINAASHARNELLLDAYIPCLFLTDTTMAVCRPVPCDDVIWWDRMENGHSPYYSIRRSALPRMAHLSELLDNGVPQPDPFL